MTTTKPQKGEHFARELAIINAIAQALNRTVDIDYAISGERVELRTKTRIYPYGPSDTLNHSDSVAHRSTSQQSDLCSTSLLLCPNRPGDGFGITLADGLCV